MSTIICRHCGGPAARNSNGTIVCLTRSNLSFLMQFVQTLRFDHRNEEVWETWPADIDYSRSMVKTDFSKTKKGKITKGGGKCLLCLEHMSVGCIVRKLPCKHHFCVDCIDPWLKKNPTCPTCRERIVK